MVFIYRLQYELLFYNSRKGNISYFSVSVMIEKMLIFLHDLWIGSVYLSFLSVTLIFLFISRNKRYVNRHIS